MTQTVNHLFEVIKELQKTITSMSEGYKLLADGFIKLQDRVTELEELQPVSKRKPFIL